MYFLWNLCCGFDIEALMFWIVFLHNIGRRITHKLISTKYLCFYWKAHILLSSQKIMLCTICNIDILNKDLHMFYIKKQRRFLSTRSSQLQHISHDFWIKNSTEICFEFVVVILTWEIFWIFLKFLHAFEGNNFRNQEIYFVVLWRYLHSTLTMYVTHPSAKYFETARCNKLFCSS